MDWIDLLEDATSRFADVLTDGDLSADVPTCPGWTLAQLGEHVRWVHLWAAHAVTEGTPDGDPGEGDLDRESLVTGYRVAADHLIAVLRDAPADAPAWTFGPAKVAGFWRRRQVHEVWMHLYDALTSQDRTSEWEMAPDLAWDGVLEVAEIFYPRQVRLGRTEPLEGTLRLVADDVDGTVDIGTGEPVTVTGDAAYLLRLLWKRADPAAPEAARLLAAAITP